MRMSDLEPGVWNDACLTWNVEYGMWDLGMRMWNITLVVEKWNMECIIDN